MTCQMKKGVVLIILHWPKNNVVLDTIKMFEFEKLSKKILPICDGLFLKS